MISLEAVLGHDRAVRVLRRALASGRLAHAYLFWGPDGVGKELAARAVAKILLCADPKALEAASACGACPSCRKCEAGEHPDLHLLAAAEKSIPVEEVRALQERLAFRAFERGRKVAIIRDSYRLTPAGANALLKTVEEPPADTFLFLLAHHRSQLLPTLASRCQLLRFDPLPEAEVARLLAARGVEAAQAARLAALSGGSPGLALTMDAGAVEEVAAEAERIASGLGAMSVAERFRLAERWSKEDRATQALFFQCLERRWLARAREDGDALDRLDRLHQVREWMDRNVNAQLALDALFVLGAGRRDAA